MLPLQLPLDLSEEHLQKLDQAMHEALAGDSEGVEKFLILWWQVSDRFDTEPLEQAREQCLAHAMSIFDSYLADSRKPEQAEALLELLCILFDDES